MIDNPMERYIESLKEIDDGHLIDVVKKDLLEGAVFRELLVKLLVLLKHKEVLTPLEVEGIASEAFDKLVWSEEIHRKEYEKRLNEIELEIDFLNKLLAYSDESEEDKK